MKTDKEIAEEFDSQFVIESHGGYTRDEVIDALEKALTKARKDEREACAEACAEMTDIINAYKTPSGHFEATSTRVPDNIDCAKMIRNRGGK